MSVRDWKSSSDPFALRVPAGPLPVRRCIGGKLDAEKLVKDGPPEGKPHRVPEKYYDGVMKGACLVADECTKDIIFE